MKEYKKIISESVSASGSPHLTTAPQVPGGRQGRQHGAGPAAGDGRLVPAPGADPVLSSHGSLLAWDRGVPRPTFRGSVTPAHLQRLFCVTVRTSRTSQEVSTLLHDRLAQPGSNCGSDGILVYIGT